MLKGKTIIELENVKTGKKETHVEENMITNAIQNLFSNNVAGMQYNLHGTSPWQQDSVNIPICPNAIGGILLYSEPLEEDADLFYAPADNLITGYASNDSHSTENALRGNYNVIESSAIPGGYRLVWEFLTTQGNGTINALGLTHALGDKSHLGCLYNDNSLKLAESYGVSIYSSDLDFNEKLPTFYRYANVVEVNFEENWYVSIYFDTTNKVVKIFKVAKPLSKMTLATNMKPYSEEVLEENILTPSTFCMGSNIAYYAFHDGKDGYWWGFQHYSNSSGNAVIQWIKIDKSDYSFTEGVWSFESVPMLSVGAFNWYTSSGNATYTYSTIRDGYLYVYNYGRTGLYKININNVADISYIPFGFQSRSSNAPLQMYVLNGFVKGPEFVLDADDNVTRVINTEVMTNYASRVFQNGVYVYTMGNYYNGYYYCYQYLYLNTPYLASINNLSEPVVKTADKTMKITYILSEIEENEEQS